MAYGVKKFRPLLRLKIVPHVTQLLRLLLYVTSFIWTVIIAGKVALDDGNASQLFGFAGMILCPLACFACLTGLLEASLSPFCLGWGVFIKPNSERSRPGGGGKYVSGFFFENFPKGAFRNGGQKITTGIHGIPTNTATKESTKEPRRLEGEKEPRPQTVYFVVNIIFSFFVLFLPFANDDFSIPLCVFSVLFGLVVLLLALKLYVFQLTDEQLLSLHEKRYIATIGMWGVRNWAQQVKRARFENELEKRLLRNSSKPARHTHHPLAHLPLPSQVAAPEPEAENAHAKRGSRPVQIIVSMILTAICITTFLAALLTGPPHGTFSRPRYIAMLTLPFACLLIALIFFIPQINADWSARRKNYRDRKVWPKTVDAGRVSGPPVSHSPRASPGLVAHESESSAGTEYICLDMIRRKGRSGAGRAWPGRLSGETLV